MPTWIYLHRDQGSMLVAAPASAGTYCIGLIHPERSLGGARDKASQNNQRVLNYHIETWTRSNAMQKTLKRWKERYLLELLIALYIMITGSIIMNIIYLSWEIIHGTWWLVLPLLGMSLLAYVLIWIALFLYQHRGSARKARNVIHNLRWLWNEQGGKHLFTTIEKTWQHFSTHPDIIRNQYGWPPW